VCVLIKKNKINFELKMLAITLEPRQHIDTYQTNKVEDWNFEVKVVNDGLFAEVRVCFLPSVKKKNNISSLEPGEVKRDFNKLQ
jgi:hypothetical protein